MGFTPQQAREMSMWQYIAAVEGFEKANGSDSEKRLTAQEHDDLWEFIQEQ